MEIYRLNGTNAVGPMNGTNEVGPLNGLEDVGPMSGTNAVGPMNGVYEPGFDVVALQGWLSPEYAIPMQGDRGTFYVSPLALADFDDVPMGEMPAGWTEEDEADFRMAYLVGDPAAMNGIRDRWRAKRDERRANRAQKEADRAQRRALRNERAKTGTRFIDKFGGALSTAAEAFKTKAEAEKALSERGIEADEDILMQRSFIGEAAGGGLIEMWNGLPTVGKGLVLGGGAFLLYKIFQSFKKKGKR